MLLLRIEELRSAVLEKQSWKEWKFLFKLGTSKVVSRTRRARLRSRHLEATQGRFLAFGKCTLICILCRFESSVIYICTCGLPYSKLATKVFGPRKKEKFTSFPQYRGKGSGSTACIQTNQISFIHKKDRCDWVKDADEPVASRLVRVH